MYCKNCGKIVDEDSLFCNNCGTRLDNIQNQTISEDKPSFGFAILGFFIPLVGLILFLIYEGKKPKRAKSAGKGALIGFLTSANRKPSRATAVTISLLTSSLTPFRIGLTSSVATA